MMEYRVRSKRSAEWVEKYKGAQVTPEMINLVLAGEARVLKPNGKPLLVYLPGAAREVADATREEFSRIRMATDNRGYASGGERGTRGNSPRLRTVPVTSGILGSFEAVGSTPYCRLTAFTAKEVERWERLLPYFERIAHLFNEYVPDRYAAQVAEARRTPPEWMIADTPFTTITVNNTYPTGLHTDKGDLDAGFSTLGCIRRGAFTGGWLTFPQYGIAADMQDGDVLLMDAHEWHGNTPITCAYCGESLRKPGHVCEEGMVPPERVSIVSYFRTEMTTCGTAEQENAKRAALQERRAAKTLGLEG